MGQPEATEAAAAASLRGRMKRRRWMMAALEGCVVLPAAASKEGGSSSERLGEAAAVSCWDGGAVVGCMIDGPAPCWSKLKSRSNPCSARCNHSIL